MPQVRELQLHLVLTFGLWPIFPCGACLWDVPYSAEYFRVMPRTLNLTFPLCTPGRLTYWETHRA